MLSGGTAYVSYPGLASLTGGKPWVSIALPAAATGPLDNGFARVATALANVNGILQVAETHGAKVTSLGSKVINGVPATGHQVTVVLHRSWHHPAPAGTHPAAAGPNPGGVHVTAQLWADSKDRLVQASGSFTRLLTATPAPALGTHPSAPGMGGWIPSGNGTLNLSGYGSPVTIAVPAPSQVTPVPVSALQGLLGHHHHDWAPPAAA